MFKCNMAPKGTGHKRSLDHYIDVSSDMRPFLKDPELKSRGLDAIYLHLVVRWIGLKGLHHRATANMWTPKHKFEEVIGVTSKHSNGQLGPMPLHQS